MTLSDFSHIEEDGQYIHVVCVSKKDGKPEAWFDWQREPEWKELGSRLDLNHDGEIEVWTYTPQKDGDLFAEYDQDYDGSPDKWVYRGGLVKTDTDGDGQPDSEKQIGTQQSGAGYPPQGVGSPDP